MWQSKAYILLQKITIFLIGILLITFSVFTFLALCSFNPNDPSLNSSSTIIDVNNWMGFPGSYISDILFQIMGLSSFLFCIILFKIGLKISSRGEKKNIIIKIILLPLSLLSFSVFLAILPEPNWWIFVNLGGVNGEFLINKIFLPKLLTAFLALIFSIMMMLIMEIRF